MANQSDNKPRRITPAESRFIDAMRENHVSVESLRMIVESYLQDPGIPDFLRGDLNRFLEQTAEPVKIKAASMCGKLAESNLQYGKYSPTCFGKYDWEDGAPECSTCHRFVDCRACSEIPE